jgi:hypothetical protein
MDKFSRFRHCRFCGESAVVWRDGAYELVKYSVRSYAHWKCLVAERGLAFAHANVPLSMQVQRFAYVVTFGMARSKPCSLRQVIEVIDLTDDARGELRKLRPGALCALPTNAGDMIAVEVSWAAAS